MIVCVAVDDQGYVGHGWGRADQVAIAEVQGGEVCSWTEYDVGWGDLHGTGPEGQHHARIVRFLREHDVESVVVGHMGQGMQHTLGKMGLRVVLGASGDARAACVAALAG
ncbi:MAG: NifB/NifX family molybdenum-iron cluster-binding protein [Nocardioides sp.]